MGKVEVNIPEGHPGRCAVLVEVEGAKVSQLTMVRALVSAIAPACELRVVYARLRAEA